ncbi:MAG TPA: DMT family transporter [Anaerolineales bacterium]|nr:DMT family transporter [Anaerolineales bacterium]
MVIIGEIAGLLTSLFWSINAVVVTKAGKMVGSSWIINRTRLVFALLYLVVLNFILYHQALPTQAGVQRWTWLSLSGVVGLAVGDAFLFQAYLMVGARLGTLLLSLSTIFGVLEAWVFLGESLSLMEIVGIALTLGGIMWVILEHGNNSQPTLRPSAWGVLCGVLAAIGQATGLVFSKQGMAGNFSPISGNVIRMSAAVIALWLITFMQREAGKTIQVLKENPSGLQLLALAALLGPVIGVSLSLLAVQDTPVGVASVLTSLSPIFILPISHFYSKEHLGWQVIAGTILATAGVSILFLF